MRAPDPILDDDVLDDADLGDPLPSNLPPVVREAALPAGFVAAGAAVGIKRSGRRDLAIVAVAPNRAEPAAAAAVFTTNAFAAAPVRISREHLAATLPSGAGSYGWTRGLVATSGRANAGTGRAGDTDQRAIARHLAATLGVPVEETLALSTGVIGTRLPVDTVKAGIDRVAANLAPAGEGFHAAAEAIRTTDSTTKVARVDGSAAGYAVAGIAKGVGMIHPRMATMLAIIATDAQVEPAHLHALLSGVTVRTWNQLSIDGDTSTNDTVFLLASGAAGGPPVEPGSAEAAALAAGIEAVARDLARQQAADGEGATILLTCQVSGGADDIDARAVAREVVASSLVKAAVHGRDPNWGRIASAAGNAHLPAFAQLVAAGLHIDEARARAGDPARVEPDRLRIALAGITVFDGAAGGPQPFDPERMRQAMAGSELLIRLDLGVGEGIGEAFGCDLTEEYVTENSEYTT